MKPLKLLLIAFVSLVLMLVSEQATTSCGWWPVPEEYRFSLFSPDLCNLKEVKPFIYTTDKIFADYTDNMINDSVYEKNVDEWAGFTSGSIKRRDIYDVMYKIEPLAFFDSIDHIELSNTFVKYLKKNNKEAYEYVVYAKKCEQVINQPDPWSDGPSGIDRDASARLLNEGEAKYSASKSDFLKLHIAFQLERLLYYLGPGYDAIDTKQQVYNKKIMASKIDSWIKNSAYYYAMLPVEPTKYAGIRFPAEEGYILSKVFDRCIDKRFSCVMQFDRKLASPLTQAKNDHERAVLYIMYELQNPGPSLKALQHIYALDPNNRYMTFLLLREVNKLEDWIVTPQLTGLGSASSEIRRDIPKGIKEQMEEGKNGLLNVPHDLQYLDRVNDFVKQLLADGRQKDQGLLRLMVSYLYIIKGDTANAALTLKEAVKLPMNDEERKQVNTCRLMLTVLTNPGLNAETEKLIMDISKKNKIFDAKGRYMEDVDVNMPNATDKTILYVGQKLIEKGYFAKGLLLLNRTKCLLDMLDIEDMWENTYQYMHEHATPKDYKEILALIDKKGKTPFEQFLVSGRAVMYMYDTVVISGPFNKYKVLDYEGTWYMNHDSLEQALQAFEQIPDNFWHQQPYTLFENDDPFKIRLNDARNFEKKDNGHWNKKTIVRHMIELKQEADRNPAKYAADYRALGNAYFSMTYYGKYWIMNKTWWSGGELGEWSNSLKQSAFNDMYYGCTLAKKYFKLAAANSKDFNSATISYYMAGKCGQNYDRYVWYCKHKDYTVTMPDFKNAFVATIKRLYPDTKKRIDERTATECTYYEDFLASAAR